VDGRRVRRDRDGFLLLADLLWVDPLAALRQSRSLARIWRRHLGDAGSVAVVVARARGRTSLPASPRTRAG